MGHPFLCEVKMFYKSKYKRLLEKCKKQDVIIKRYVAMENNLEQERKRVEKLVNELEQTKKKWADEISAMKAERIKYTETIRQLILLKKQIFKEIDKKE